MSGRSGREPLIFHRGGYRYTINGSDGAYVGWRDGCVVVRGAERAEVARALIVRPACAPGPKLSQANVEAIIDANVSSEANIITDEAAMYKGLSWGYLGTQPTALS